MFLSKRDASWSRSAQWPPPAMANLTFTLILHHLYKLASNDYCTSGTIIVATLTAFGFDLVAFAAACVRAKLSTITATNKLQNHKYTKLRLVFSTLSHVLCTLDKYECLQDDEEQEVDQNMLVIWKRAAVSAHTVS